MSRVILIICCTLYALVLSGCIGLIIGYPEYHPVVEPRPFDTNKEATKTDFLKYWGKPDSIVVHPDNAAIETWHYKRNHWCGIIPVLIVPIPLVLPVCTKDNRIRFDGKIATTWEGYKMWTSGFVFPVGPCNEFFPSSD